MILIFNLQDEESYSVDRKIILGIEDTNEEEASTDSFTCNLPFHLLFKTNIKTWNNDFLASMKIAEFICAFKNVRKNVFYIFNK